MARNTVHVDAPTEAVFDVLADGWRYTNWVVGTSHMRAVDAAWPAVGSKLYHAAGAWPLLTRDETEVTAVDPGRSLSLIARGRPFGEAAIRIELTAADGGCDVVMYEKPSAGPGKWLHNPVAEAVLVRRNTESLARFAALCERRSQPSE
ncbi:SRPBCC family protein [uncultured Jatrophihabitans sp.]|uniref:SRPBCC family protein n=1 Tax=uncultured Jatrophihabitans sp. TaxID=1610747 RepID=UPI0035CAC649